MNSYDSILGFAKRIESDLPRVDYTLLNAGVGPLNSRRNETTDQLKVVQVNYLSTVLLTLLLLPIYKAQQHGQSTTQAAPRTSITSAALTLSGQFPIGLQIRSYHPSLHQQTSATRRTLRPRFLCRCSCRACSITFPQMTL